MATGIFAIGVKTKAYADKGIKGGGTIQSRIEGAFQSVLPSLLTEIRHKYLLHQSSGSIEKRKGNIYRNTKYEIKRTPSGGVSGGVVIGEGVPYASIHVGTGGSAEFMHASGKPFVIPLPWARNKDGRWRSPYVPGQLRNVPGLFKGSKKYRLNPNYLYQRYKTRGPKPMFKLQRTIRVPTRVDIGEVKETMRVRLQEAMVQYFEGYDFGYMRMLKSK